MKMASRMIGRINIKNAALFLCDMQQKFRPSVKYFKEIVTVSNRLLRVAKLIDIPVVVTQQYPKGLGPTVPELGIEEYGITPFDKTQFSMMLPEVEKYLKSKNPNVNSIILCGIETHACIQQTTFSLLEKGYDVHVVVDACSSRSMADRKYAFERMKESGAHLTTSEGAILELMRGAEHPQFKDVQKIIMESAPDTGLSNL